MANRKHYNLQQMVAGGYSSDHSSIHKFGATNSMSIGTTGTIWDVDDTLYPWSAWDTAGTVVLTSTSTEDDEDKGGGVAGTGAHRVLIIGLDEDYNQIEEELITNGTSTRTSTKTFKRIFRAYVSAGATNIGTISISRGGTDVAVIRATNGQTLMSVYTVPAGYIGYLYKGTSSIEKSGDATACMHIRKEGTTAFRIAHTFEVEGEGGQYTYDFSFPPALAPKTDIDVRATMRSNNSRMTAAFDLLLVENDPNAPITSSL